MARHGKIVLVSGAVPRLLKSPEIAADLAARARRIAAAAGPGHEVEVTTGATRARATIHTDTIDAIVSEATARTLTSAVDAGR